MANPSIYAAFERMWQHIVAVVGSKTEIGHSHEVTDVTDLQNMLDDLDVREELANKANSDTTYTKTEVDNLIADVEVAGTGIYVGSGDMPENCVLQVDPSGSASSVPSIVIISHVSDTLFDAANTTYAELVSMLQNHNMPIIKYFSYGFNSSTPDVCTVCTVWDLYQVTYDPENNWIDLYLICTTNVSAASLLHLRMYNNNSIILME